VSPCNFPSYRPSLLRAPVSLGFYGRRPPGSFTLEHDFASVFGFPLTLLERFSRFARNVSDGVLASENLLSRASLSSQRKCSPLQRGVGVFIKDCDISYFLIVSLPESSFLLGALDLFPKKGVTRNGPS